MTKLVTATIQFEVGDDEYEEWGSDPEVVSVSVSTETDPGEVDDWYYSSTAGEGGLKNLSFEIKDKPREWKFGDEVTRDNSADLPDSAVVVFGANGLNMSMRQLRRNDWEAVHSWPRLVYLKGQVEW